MKSCIYIFYNSTHTGVRCYTLSCGANHSVNKQLPAWHFVAQCVTSARAGSISAAALHNANEPPERRGKKPLLLGRATARQAGRQPRSRKKTRVSRNVSKHTAEKFRRTSKCLLSVKCARQGRAQEGVGAQIIRKSIRRLLQIMR